MNIENLKKKEKEGLQVFSWSPSDYNLPLNGSGSVFAIICHMATVLWVQTEICNGSVHPNSRVFHLHSSLAQLHYLQGIQRVMVCQGANLLAISTSLVRSWKFLFRTCLCLEKQNNMSNR